MLPLCNLFTLITSGMKLQDCCWNMGWRIEEEGCCREKTRGEGLTQCRWASSSAGQCSTFHPDRRLHLPGRGSRAGTSATSTHTNGLFDPKHPCRTVFVFSVCSAGGAHLHLLQPLQFGHQVVDLAVFLRQHGLQPLQLSRVGSRSLQLHQGCNLDLQNQRTEHARLSGDGGDVDGEAAAPARSLAFMRCICCLLKACSFCSDWCWTFMLMSCLSISALRSSSWKATSVHHLLSQFCFATKRCTSSPRQTENSLSGLDPEPPEEPDPAGPAGPGSAHDISAQKTPSMGKISEELGGNSWSVRVESSPPEH